MKCVGAALNCEAIHGNGAEPMCNGQSDADHSDGSDLLGADEQRHCDAERGEATAQLGYATAKQSAAEGTALHCVGMDGIASRANARLRRGWHGREARSSGKALRGYGVARSRTTVHCMGMGCAGRCKGFAMKRLASA